MSRAEILTVAIAMTLVGLGLALLFWSLQ